MASDEHLPEYLRSARADNRELLGAAQNAVIGDFIHAVTADDPAVWRPLLDGAFGNLSGAQFHVNGEKSVNSLLHAELRFFLQRPGPFTMQDLENAARAWAPLAGWASESMVGALREAHGHRSPHRDPAGAVEALSVGVPILVDAQAVHRLGELGVAVARRATDADSPVESSDNLLGLVDKTLRDLRGFERSHLRGLELDTASTSAIQVEEHEEESQRVAEVAPTQETHGETVRELLAAAMTDPTVQAALKGAVPEDTSLLGTPGTRPLPELVSIEAVRQLLHAGLPVTPLSVADRQSSLAHGKGIPAKDLHNIARYAEPTPASSRPSDAVMDAALAVRADYWQRRGVALGIDVAGLGLQEGGVLDRIGAIRGLLSTMRERLLAEPYSNGSLPQQQLKAAFAALAKGGGSAGQEGQVRSTPAVTLPTRSKPGLSRG